MGDGSGLWLEVAVGCGTVKFWLWLCAVAVTWTCGYGLQLGVLAVALVVGRCIMPAGRL